MSVQLVSPDAPKGECVALGARLAEQADSPVGLLVLGDGSPKHGDRAPVRPDERARDFDNAVQAAFKNADPEALLALDQDLAAELGAQGRAPWQVLAGTGMRWQCVSSELMVPFGVAYHVAVWEPVQS